MSVTASIVSQVPVVFWRTVSAVGFHIQLEPLWSLVHPITRGYVVHHRYLLYVVCLVVYSKVGHVGTFIEPITEIDYQWIRPNPYTFSPNCYGLT